MTRVMLSFFTVLGVCLAPVGPVEAREPDSKAIVNDLKKIGMAYHKFLGGFDGKPPTKAEDLAPHLDKDQRVIDLLKNKDVIFIYGVSPIEMTEGGTVDTIVAYEKNVPTKGGAVLYGDGHVKKITADEFKKAILAKPKKK